MSRTTHDIYCKGCGYKGSVVDDSITCPQCKKSVEGQPISAKVIEALFKKPRIEIGVPPVFGVERAG